MSVPAEKKGGDAKQQEESKSIDQRLRDRLLHTLRQDLTCSPDPLQVTMLDTDDNPTAQGKSQGVLTSHFLSLSLPGTPMEGECKFLSSERLTTSLTTHTKLMGFRWQAESITDDKAMSAIDAVATTMADRIRHHVNDFNEIREENGGPKASHVTLWKATVSLPSTPEYVNMDVSLSFAPDS